MQLRDYCWHCLSTKFCDGIEVSDHLSTVFTQLFVNVTYFYGLSQHQFKQYKIPV
jgi:hypothetical protein